MLKLDGFVSRSLFDLFSNFTYFLDDPQRGDQFEQVDDRTVGKGARGPITQRVQERFREGRGAADGLLARFEEWRPPAGSRFGAPFASFPRGGSPSRR